MISCFADLSFFPEELHGVYSAEKAQRFARLSAHRTQQEQTDQPSFRETLAKLTDLERHDHEEAEGGKEDGDDDDDGEDEVVYEEEELEDETDYNLTYFDNGEDYGDHDDGDEGPLY